MRNIVDDYDIDVHIHLPETEVAKDVSINGAAAAVALISLMIGIPARRDVAILGELTLAGILWPLEQVNEAEVYTARCGKIKHLIVPEENILQLQRIGLDVLQDLSVTGASYLMDVLHILFPHPGARNQQITVPIPTPSPVKDLGSNGTKFPNGNTNGGDSLPVNCIIQPIKDTGLISLLNPRLYMINSNLGLPHTHVHNHGLAHTHGQAMTAPPLAVAGTMPIQTTNIGIVHANHDLRSPLTFNNHDVNQSINQATTSHNQQIIGHSHNESNYSTLFLY